VNLIAPPPGGAIFGLIGAIPALALNAVTYLTPQVSIASVASFGPERPGGVIADHRGPRTVMGISGFAFLLLALNLLGSRAVLSERR
jgi:hypothetical protein